MKQMKKVAGSVAGVRAKAAAAGAALLTGAGSAMAGGGGSGFDSSSILTAITDNTATALTIIGAFILGVWTLKSMGLLKRG